VCFLSNLFKIKEHLILNSPEIEKKKEQNKKDFKQGWHIRIYLKNILKFSKF
jgi:hypothetical protein